MKRLSNCLYYINCAKNFFSKDYLLRIYYALFQSHLSYGILLWSNTSQANINLSGKAQKKAVRLISKAQYNSPTEHFFKNLKILN